MKLKGWLRKIKGKNDRLFAISEGTRTSEKHQAPSSKLQHPLKHQISSSNPNLPKKFVASSFYPDLVRITAKGQPLMLGAWRFSGGWSLEFGAFTPRQTCGSSAPRD